MERDGIALALRHVSDIILYWHICFKKVVENVRLVRRNNSLSAQSKISSLAAHTNDMLWSWLSTTCAGCANNSQRHSNMCSAYVAPWRKGIIRDATTMWFIKPWVKIMTWFKNKNPYYTCRPENVMMNDRVQLLCHWHKTLAEKRRKYQALDSYKLKK